MDPRKTERRARPMSVVLVLVVTASFSAVVMPDVASSVIRYAKNADRVDGFHAVGAGAQRQARRLVATNRSGHLPEAIVAHAQNARRLGGYPHDRYVTTCERGSVAGYAHVDAGVGADWTEVTGYGTMFAAGGPPPAGDAPANEECTFSPASARRVAPGTYQVALSDDVAGCGDFDVAEPAAVITVNDARALFASYEGACDEEKGIIETVRIFDNGGVPTDAAFTITILAPPRVIPLP